MLAPARSFSGWHETSGRAIVNRMSAKRPRCATLADVALGLLVWARPALHRSRRCRALGEALELGLCHAETVPATVTIARLVKAVRIHEDGGPEVLRYEDVPDPEAGPGRGARSGYGRRR